MSCITCTELKPLNRCFTNLNLGTYGSSSGVDLYVYFKNVATGNTRRVSATTGAAGAVQVTGISFVPDHTYEVWMNEESETQTEQGTFVIDSTNLTCGLLRFQTFKDGSNAKIIDTTVTAAI